MTDDGSPPQIHPRLRFAPPFGRVVWNVVLSAVPLLGFLYVSWGFFLNSSILRNDVSMLSNVNLLSLLLLVVLLTLCIAFCGAVCRFLFPFPSLEFRDGLLIVRPLVGRTQVFRFADLGYPTVEERRLGRQKVKVVRIPIQRELRSRERTSFLLRFCVDWHTHVAPHAVVASAWAISASPQKVIEAMERIRMSMRELKSGPRPEIDAAARET